MKDSGQGGARRMCRDTMDFPGKSWKRGMCSNKISRVCDKAECLFDRAEHFWLKLFVGVTARDLFSLVARKKTDGDVVMCCAIVRSTWAVLFGTAEAVFFMLEALCSVFKQGVHLPVLPPPPPRPSTPRAV